MARRLDEILVVDVESTCWEGDPPPGQASEIIEIGVCPLVIQTLERGERRSLLVKPVQSELSAFCTHLTTLTPEMLTEAGTLADACTALVQEYRSRDRLWASWGDYDRRQFDRVCAEQRVPYPFGPTHLNVKTLFAVSGNLGREVGLDGAFAQLGWTLEGTHHRGGDDAWNIARILADLIGRTREN